jgi:predicted enzyme related to lactoylglutathione lyase
MGDAPLRGRLMWFELMTKDLPAAEKFYTSVVGWTITPFAGAGMPYSMFTRAGEVPVAGAMTLPAELTQHGVPPHWGMYVGVEKLEPAAADVERLGGGTLSPVIDVPTIGRMQTMRDPQGAAFSIYEPASPPPAPEAMAEAGEVSWIELMTTDAPAAMQFYRDLFGWQPTEAMDMGPMGKYHMFGRHLGPLGGMMNKPKELAQVPPNWGIYFLVPDLDAAVARVKTGGGQILNGPMEVPGGDRIVNCLDPQGAAFSLHAKKAA